MRKTDAMQRGFNFSALKLAIGIRSFLFFAVFFVCFWNFFFSAIKNSLATSTCYLERLVFFFFMHRYIPLHIFLRLLSHPPSFQSPTFPGNFASHHCRIKLAMQLYLAEICGSLRWNICSTLTGNRYPLPFMKQSRDLSNATELLKLFSSE